MSSSNSQGIIKEENLHSGESNPNMIKNNNNIPNGPLECVEEQKHEDGTYKHTKKHK